MILNLIYCDEVEIDAATYLDNESEQKNSKTKQKTNYLKNMTHIHATRKHVIKIKLPTTQC